jgi:cytochrome P450
MWKIAALVLGLWLLYSITTAIISFQHNLRKARNSGIKYVVVPFYYLKTWWLAGHTLFLPILARLPRSWTQWVDYCIPDFYYRRSIEVFQKMGSDTFLVVAPGGTIMHTADPAVITQMTTRRNDFPKPIGIYRSLDIYGKNVVTTEGSIWRQHRKATSPPFTEKNNHLVWLESIDQANDMLNSWLGPDGKGDVTIDRVMDDTMRLSLYVISRAGFGRKLKWPATDAKGDIDNKYDDPSKILNEQKDRDAGHSMSYTYAIHCLLDNILLQFLLPKWVVSRVPHTKFRKATESYREWGNYMREAIESKKRDLASNKNDSKDQMDLLAQLVKGQVDAEKGLSTAKDTPLTDTEVLGNMFVLILAGHETAANSIHFSLVYLALNPKSQRACQKDLDKIFEGRPTSEWDYDRDLPGLFGSMVGAVLAEELRLAPPVIGIPKSTWGVGDQQLTVDGKSCTVPGGIYVNVGCSNVHRNPKYWPVSKPALAGGQAWHRTANLDNDLEEFHPERWLLDAGEAIGSVAANGDKKSMPAEAVADDLNINEAADTSDKFHRPPKGAYIPFSDGYRACLGRRFAQVEVLATLAVILQNYSVELAVDKYASDAEVVAMDRDARIEVWQQAARRARDLLANGLSVIISLQMRAGHVPLRFVPRGKEKFPDDVDERWKAKHPEMCKEPRFDPNYRFWDNRAKNPIS